MFRSTLKGSLPVIGLLLIGSLTQAQRSVETQGLLWSGYFLKMKINDNYLILQEVEERAYGFPWRQHQFVLRSQLQRNLPKGWRANLGFTYFLQTLPHDPFSEEMEHLSELRPQLEFGNRQTVHERWEIDHRYRTDFRFFEDDQKQFEFGSVRWRYRIQVSYRPADWLALKAFDEIHIHVGPVVEKNVFDQNRVGASAHFRPDKAWGAELTYFHWFQQRPSGTDFYSRHIVRLTFHHTINLKRN